MLNGFYMPFERRYSVQKVFSIHHVGARSDAACLFVLHGTFPSSCRFLLVAAIAPMIQICIQRWQIDDFGFPGDPTRISVSHESRLDRIERIDWTSTSLTPSCGGERPRHRGGRRRRGQYRIAFASIGHPEPTNGWDHGVGCGRLVVPIPRPSRARRRWLSGIRVLIPTRSSRPFDLGEHLVLLPLCRR